MDDAFHLVRDVVGILLMKIIIIEKKIKLKDGDATVYAAENIYINKEG